MTITEGITLSVAVIGAVLGIVNIVRDLAKDRVRLRVIPKLAVQADDGSGRLGWITGICRNPFPDSATQRLCVEIVNLSTFPVTVKEVGFGRKEGPQGLRHVMTSMHGSGDQLPKRLESRQSMTVYDAYCLTLDPRLMTHAVAYAETDCGTRVYGTSPAFQSYVQELRLKGKGQ